MNNKNKYKNNNKVALVLEGGATKELFYYGDWIKKNGVAICSCNDGLRPVIFKIESEQ